MKRFFLFAAGVLICLTAMAQEPQLDSTLLERKAVFDFEKPNFAKGMHVIANTRFASNNNFMDGTFVDSKFQMNEFRFEIVGDITDKLSYRFRDMYSYRPTAINTQDALRNSIDLAFITYRFSDKFSMSAGKVATEWGSYEFDTNPIFIYVFNDFIQFDDHFVGGVLARYKATKNHTFTLQAVNSRTRSFQEIYGSIPGVEPSKAALGGTFNWRGKFADGMFSTIWSTSMYNEAKDKWAYYVALGNQLKAGNLLIQYDFKYSTQEIDRLGVTSRFIPTSVYAYRLQDVKYMEHWLKGMYYFTPRLSATLIGMVASNYWDDNPLADLTVAKNSHLRDSWSFTAALEYTLYIPYDVKVFATYVGRYNRFTSYAQDRFGLSNYNTGLFLIGFVTPLVLF